MRSTKHGVDKIPFVRMEATTNLIGGQPFSLANLREVKALIAPLGIPLVLDASLISENAYFIRQREAGICECHPSKRSSSR